jgi:hypothetical protein
VHVQNDALGQAQLFEYDDGRLFALTNRVSALAALGVQLAPVAQEWAVRAALGWFPLQLSGYRNVRFVEPGTRLVLDRGGVRRASFDVLRRWVAPAPLPEAECLELARSSLVRAIAAGAALWEKPKVGLSGGRDTRAVVSVLRSLGIEFAARVRGSLERPDVVVAQRLADIAAFPLRVRTTAGLPPEDAAECRRSISLALRWQAGYMVSSKHKTFLSRQTGLDGGVVNVMGQHGEIGRSYYARMIRAADSAEQDFESVLTSALLAKIPLFLRGELADYVRETIRTAYRQAGRYELTGRRRLDFFYLYERTRRWASGSLSSQDGIVFAPFLNPDFVRAVFAAPSSTDVNRFHQHIVASHAPDWLGVPYADELPRRRVAGTADTADWRKQRGNHHYDSRLYWRSVGSPIIEEALAEEGWWTEVFDPSSARSTWHDAPDELAIAYLLPEAIAGPPRAAAEHRAQAPAPTPP